MVRYIHNSVMMLVCRGPFALGIYSGEMHTFFGYDVGVPRSLRTRHMVRIDAIVSGVLYPACCCFLNK